MSDSTFFMSLLCLILVGFVLTIASLCVLIG